MVTSKYFEKEFARFKSTMPKYSREMISQMSELDLTSNYNQKLFISRYYLIEPISIGNAVPLLESCLKIAEHFEITEEQLQLSKELYSHSLNILDYIFKNSKLRKQEKIDEYILIENCVKEKLGNLEKTAFLN